MSKSTLADTFLISLYYLSESWKYGAVSLPRDAFRGQELYRNCVCACVSVSLWLFGERAKKLDFPRSIYRAKTSKLSGSPKAQISW